MADPRYDDNTPLEEDNGLPKWLNWTNALIVAALTFIAGLVGKASKDESLHQNTPLWDEKKGVVDNVRGLFKQSGEGLGYIKDGTKEFITGEKQEPPEKKADTLVRQGAQKVADSKDHIPEVAVGIGAGWTIGKKAIEYAPNAWDAAKGAVSSAWNVTKGAVSNGVEYIKNTDAAKNALNRAEYINQSSWLGKIVSSPVGKFVTKGSGLWMAGNAVSQANTISKAADILDSSGKGEEAIKMRKAALLEGTSGAVEGVSAWGGVVGMLAGTAAKDATYVYSVISGDGNSHGVTRSTAADFIGKDLHFDDAAEWIMDHGAGRIIATVVGDDIPSAPTPPPQAQKQGAPAQKTGK